MPPEEQKPMPRPELHATQENTAATNQSACTYPLETLMALQKMLEGGIPEHTANEAPSRPVQRTGSHRPTRQSYNDQFHTRLSRLINEWRNTIRAFLTRGKKSKATGGKGNSAQQTG